MNLNDESFPRVTKWPFFLFDVLLVGFGVFVVAVASWPLSRWEIGAVVICFAVGAFIAIVPSLREHAAEIKLREQAGLASATVQLRQLESLATQIARATSNWQAIHDQSARAVGAADTLAQQLQAEAKSFKEFAGQGEEQQRQALRLEVEKLRRGEVELVQALVHMLDHTYALFQAAARSGQPGITQQLGNFRTACLDAVRRVGVVAHEARPGDIYESKIHQTPDGKEPPPGSRIQHTVACGYSFQGLGIRPIVVAIDTEDSESESESEAGSDEVEQS